MRTRFLSQPFGPIGQPQTLGQVLIVEILSNPYRQLEISVAYATSSGTSRLYGALLEFGRRGAPVTVHLGLANGVTSAQAVDHLLRAGVTVFGFQTGGTVLFHPKIYLLQGPRQTWVSIGSSNLTADGLFRNFEANSISICDPKDAGDRIALRELLDTLANLRRMHGVSRQITSADVAQLIASGSLIDETLTPLPQRVSADTTSIRRRRGSVIRLRVPAAPPPHPDLGTVRRPPAAQAVASQAAIPAATLQPRRFAMTLSDFDTSHRRGVPGTPEISLPEESVAFFPAVQLQGRQYPDAYFEVLLNERAGTARRVRYRIWQRPPGATTGHSDWRINVGHDTIDQTLAGGDILLLERLPDGSAPPYEVWIVQVADPEHGRLLARCTRTVQSRGRAGIKQYGLF